MSERAERMAERVNGALGTLLHKHDDLYLLGEDIADPYGGAFRVTRNLSTSYPDRVLSTPISENGIMGVAGGLALSGNRVIVEVMFGDFIALGFDQILNFAAKSVTMYGHRQPMRLVVRCPVGGHRGYGPTHSQSLQKHFIGIPSLALYELSAFHDPAVVFEQAFDRGEPAIVFEHKLLYGQRAYRDGKVDHRLRYTFEGPAGDWAHVYPSAAGPESRADLLVLAPGGSAGAAIEAARAVMKTESATVRVLVPARLYPVDVSPVLGLARGAAGICVVEESTAGGTWGTEVARHLYERLWGSLPRPIALLNSADSVIPSAPHLEREVLLQPRDIESALRALLSSPTATGPTAIAANSAGPLPEGAGFEVQAGTPVTVPKLNNNDESYMLVSWLAGDGVTVTEGDVIAEIETSKALEELAASGSGVLRHGLPENAECRPGEQIGLLLDQAARTVAAQAGAGAAGNGRRVREDSAGAAAGVLELDRTQQQVARVVTASHRDIPAAFAVRQASLDALAGLRRSLDELDAEPVGLLEVIVKLIADQYAAFGACFATLDGQRHFRVADGAHVSVTMDAGSGLFMPVVRHAERRPLADIADLLTDFRLRAVRGTFTEEQLRDPSIAVSWNHAEQVVLVQPVIPPGVSCVVSVGGPLPRVRLDANGRVVAGQVVNLGLAHDHRLINGAAAVEFLNAIATSLEDRTVLEKCAAAGSATQLPSARQSS